MFSRLLQASVIVAATSPPPYAHAAAADVTTAAPTISIGQSDVSHPDLKPMTLNLNAGKFFDAVNISRGETTLANVAARYKALGVTHLRLHDYDAEHGHPL